jgi:hypothetical protein
VRIWDVPPGYLNRQSLLGEHRELHGVYSILVHGKAGYSRHPETVRWVGCLSGLARRHAHLVAEMRLRGYSDLTPVVNPRRQVRWPDVFVTPAAAQYELLRVKYEGREAGRIPLPRSAQELWAHHKYSVLARGQTRYRNLGRRVARMRRGGGLTPLAEELIAILRESPPPHEMVNALEHMWGHVSGAATAGDRAAAQESSAGLLHVIAELAAREQEPYLLTSTALGELAVFLKDDTRSPRRLVHELARSGPHGT